MFRFFGVFSISGDSRMRCREIDVELKVAHRRNFDGEDREKAPVEHPTENFTLKIAKSNLVVFGRQRRFEEFEIFGRVVHGEIVIFIISQVWIDVRSLSAKLIEFDLMFREQFVSKDEVE